MSDDDVSSEYSSTSISSDEDDVGKAMMSDVSSEDEDLIDEEIKLTFMKKLLRKIENLKYDPITPREKFNYLKYQLIKNYINNIVDKNNMFTNAEKDAVEFLIEDALIELNVE